MLKGPTMKAKPLIIGAFVLAATAPVSAALISFDFNAPVQTGATGWNSGVNTDGLSGANVTGLNSYMNSVLAGTTVSGALATRNYNGDGFVIPGDPTLGTSDGATAFNDSTHNHANAAPYDGFLMNNNFPVLGQPASNLFTIVVPSGVALGTVSFDWEIFPDNTCSSGSCLNNPSDGNFPTLLFKVDGTQVSTFYALTSTALGGTSAHPIDPQNLGTASFNLNIAASSSTHTLTFVDWPPEIGIDNLKIQTCRSTDAHCLGQAVPEPSPLPLVALALALLAFVRWEARRRRPNANVCPLT